jgi:hypothetical protein
MSVREEYADMLQGVLGDRFAVVAYPGAIKSYGSKVQWVVTLASVTVVPRGLTIGQLTETLLAVVSYNGEWTAEREPILEQGRDLFIESARDPSGLAWWTKAERQVIDNRQAWSFDLTAYSIIDTETE